MFMGIFWYYSQALSDTINEEWGERFVKKQILFDKYRTLLPISREMEKVRKLAHEPAIVAMALEDENISVRASGIAVLEQYQTLFEDRSYFAAFVKTSNYYFDDSSGQYKNQQLRYKLSPSNVNDAWFYITLRGNNDISVNIDRDDHLNITKVWFNSIVRHKGEAVGVVGSGFEFHQFLKESVGIEQEGIKNYFIDQNFAIQLAKEINMIDYASITKKDGTHKTIESLFSTQHDISLIKNAMTMLRLTGERDKVATQWVNIDGKRVLVGVAYLAEIDWYSITMIDSNELILVDSTRVFLLFSLLFLIALGLLSALLNYLVVNPLAILKEQIRKIEAREYSDTLAVIGSGEIAQVSLRFNDMAKVIREHNEELEKIVQERTKEISQLAFYDALTQLPNRRLLNDRLIQALAQSKRNSLYGAVLFLDMDNFKPLNDTYGHDIGDLLLVKVANRLKNCVREVDIVARFGGDEFVVILSELSEDIPKSHESALSIAHKIQEVLNEKYVLVVDEVMTVEHHCSVSIGGVLFGIGNENKEEILHMADQAMYLAKEAGGSSVRFI